MKDTTFYWILGAGAVGGLGLILKDPVENAVITATRTPDDILSAVADISPQTNPDLQPGANGGADWCNKFVSLVTDALGAPVPDHILADAQIEWLSGGGGGWYPLSQDDAQAAALAGHVAVAAYYNPGGHGHVALVLPIDGTLQIAQAGASCFNQGSLSKGFGLLPVQFYAHA